MGLKHGFGRLSWSDEKYFEGFWINNRQHGEGLIIEFRICCLELQHCNAATHKCVFSFSLYLVIMKETFRLRAKVHMFVIGVVLY